MGGRVTALPGISHWPPGYAEARGAPITHLRSAADGRIAAHP
jgi:hypothetical protein